MQKSKYLICSRLRQRPFSRCHHRERAQGGGRWVIPSTLLEVGMVLSLSCPPCTSTGTRGSRYGVSRWLAGIWVVFLPSRLCISGRHSVSCHASLLDGFATYRLPKVPDLTFTSTTLAIPFSALSLRKCSFGQRPRVPLFPQPLDREAWSKRQSLLAGWGPRGGPIGRFGRRAVAEHGAWGINETCRAMWLWGCALVGCAEGLRDCRGVCTKYGQRVSLYGDLRCACRVARLMRKCEVYFVYFVFVHYL